MKIIGVTLLIFISLIGLSFGIDLLMGFDMITSLRNSVSPLAVMEPVEYFIFLALIFLYLGKTTTLFFQGKKQKMKKQG